MQKNLTFLTLILIFMSSVTCIAMEGDPNNAKPDLKRLRTLAQKKREQNNSSLSEISLKTSQGDEAPEAPGTPPKWSSTESISDTSDGEKKDALEPMAPVTQPAEALRKVLFDTVQKFSAKKLEERDEDVITQAQTTYDAISTHYPSQATRDNRFLYGLPLLLQAIATEDKQPYRQYYTPIEVVREVKKKNETEKKAYQRTLGALQTQERELQEQLEKVQKDKEAQQCELTYILRANKALTGQANALAATLVNKRDKLKETIESDIKQFVELKQQLKKASVGHATTNCTEQLKPLGPKIEDNIKQLWYCTHYLERFKKPDGQLDWGQAIEWKFSMVKPATLGITNYQDYVDHK